MLTPGEYDRLEEEAKTNFPVLYEDQKWAVEDDKTWQSHVDFPLRVSDYTQLGCLLNRFQRGRFEGYMSELDGLTDQEIDQFKSAIHKIELIARYIRNYDYPMDQLMASLAVHRKIRMAKSGPISILEIGPGPGLTALFFSQDPEITKYTQIETTQSLYLLQEIVNQVSGLKVDHLTWWSEIPDTRYDVITANAVLNEVTDKALARYLDIFDKKSHEKTLLFIQCPGGEVNRTDEELLKIISDAGWHLKKISYMGFSDPLLSWWFMRHPDFNFNTNYPPRKILNKDHFNKVRTF